MAAAAGKSRPGEVVDSGHCAAVWANDGPTVAAGSGVSGDVISHGWPLGLSEARNA